jgi:hypothetical protein
MRPHSVGKKNNAGPRARTRSDPTSRRSGREPEPDPHPDQSPYTYSPGTRAI